MKKSALIVDDEIGLREVLTELLRIWDFEVIEAESGEQALECVANTEETFDLIFIDVNLPGLSGRELFEHLQPDFPQASYILMSGFDREQNAAELPESEDYIYLKKPFRVGELKDLIDRLLTQ
ncbi:response regulator [Calditrichota bacterium GD2]